MEKELEIGRVCEKAVGKEKGKICVIIDKLDGNMVMIDGNVKRRKCNVSHLNPLEKIIAIKKGEKAEKVREALEKEGIEVARKMKVKERLRVKREAEKEAKKALKKKGK